MTTTAIDQDRDRTAPPRAPVRVMQVIAALANHRDGLSLAQLSDVLQLPKTSLFSLLRALEEGGYVMSENGHHRLGQETYSLAALIQKIDGFPGNVRSWLNELHQACQETVLVGVPSKDWTQLIYVDVIEASSWLRYSANVGARRPLYSTSLGLTMLAFTSTERQRHYIESTRLDAVTHHTITSRSALQQALRRIRAAGCACSSGSIEGATGVSAPVFDRDGSLLGAVGLAGPTARYERNADQFRALVVRCGEQMSRALGFTGAYPNVASHPPGPR
ncbi:IclR family transcriptional regulator [Ottowia sp.]|uniref:IclR family transcriptional regulator n=1 Tax=Ottowia sp. TaxID=1898956 RepID=UPI0011D44460|nr:IclR family transcriptional regulator [Ottowia sp.]TXI22673.1 MAG: IclR family transcriptional regulator [Ottowia sp.]HNR83490.1 IclR family transcriptional regulator [Ottowia sp.]